MAENKVKNAQISKQLRPTSCLVYPGQAEQERKPEHVIEAHQAVLKIQIEIHLPHVSYFLNYSHQGQEYSSQEKT